MSEIEKTPDSKQSQTQVNNPVDSAPQSDAQAYSSIVKEENQPNFSVNKEISNFSVSASQISTQRAQVLQSLARVQQNFSMKGVNISIIEDMIKFIDGYHEIQQHCTRNYQDFNAKYNSYLANKEFAVNQLRTLDQKSNGSNTTAETLFQIKQYIDYYAQTIQKLKDLENLRKDYIRYLQQNFDESNSQVGSATPSQGLAGSYASPNSSISKYKNNNEENEFRSSINNNNPTPLNNNVTQSVITGMGGGGVNGNSRIQSKMNNGDGGFSSNLNSPQSGGGPGSFSNFEQFQFKVLSGLVDQLFDEAKDSFESLKDDFIKSEDVSKKAEVFKLFEIEFQRYKAELLHQRQLLELSQMFFDYYISPNLGGILEQTFTDADADLALYQKTYLYLEKLNVEEAKLKNEIDVYYVEEEQTIQQVIQLRDKFLEDLYHKMPNFRENFIIENQTDPITQMEIKFERFEQLSHFRQVQLQEKLKRLKDNLHYETIRNLTTQFNKNFIDYDLQFNQGKGILGELDPISIARQRSPLRMTQVKQKELIQSNNDNIDDFDKFFTESDFLQRMEFFDRFDKHFLERGNTPIVIYGDDGNGKTRLVHEYSKKFEKIIIINADLHSIQLQLEESLEAKDPNIIQEKLVQEEIVQRFYQNLDSETLVIVEDANDVSQISPYLPPPNFREINIIITTVLKKWPIKVNGIPPLENDEIQAYMVQNLMISFSPESIRKLNQLINGNLLGLALAAAYMKKNSMKIDEFVELVEKASVLPNVIEQHKSMFKIWQTVTIQLVESNPNPQQGQLIQKILNFSTYLHRNSIQVQLLENFCKVEISSAIKALADAQIIVLNETQKEIKLNYLVQRFLKHQLEDSKTTKTHLSTMVQYFLPLLDFTRSNQFQQKRVSQIIPHCCLIAYYQDDIQVQSVQQFFDKIGYYYLYAAEQPLVAQYYLQQSLDLTQKLGNAYHVDMAVVLTNLSFVSAGMKEYQKQIQYLEMALTIKQQKLGKENASTAITLMNLGSAYGSIQKYDQCKDFMLRALKIEEKVNGLDNVSNAFTLSNLGKVCKTLKQYDNALQYQQRAYDLFLKHYGENHQNTVQTLKELTAVQQVMQKPK